MKDTVTPSPAVGVLDILDANISRNLYGRHYVKGSLNHKRDVVCRDAIAELIAANVEFDIADNLCFVDSSVENMKRRNAANCRLSAALAAIRSGGGLV